MVTVEVSPRVIDFFVSVNPVVTYALNCVRVSKLREDYLCA